MEERTESGTDSFELSRRRWLQSAIGGLVSLAGSGGVAVRAQQPASATADPANAEEAEFSALRKRMEDFRIGPLQTAQSAHYQTIGDVPEAFLKVMLDDCEQLAADYVAHFRARKFDVKLPEHRMNVAIFRDERSFGRYLRMPAPSKTSGAKAVLQPTGVYDRETNVLHVFDWRNVPMTPRSGNRNMETLAHEGTHQLTFNTGLLSRGRDIPVCIVEGLGTYGESRLPIGPTEFGRRNVRRLDELAKIQRQIPWIPMKELFLDDSILRAGKAARVLLGYAQSWLLVHYLLKTPAQVPKFRDYVKAIAERTGAEHRLEDARAHLGDLDALDRTLRRYSARLLSTY